MAFTIFLFLSLIIIDFPSYTICRAVPDHHLRSAKITLTRPIEIGDDLIFPKATELIIERAIIGEWDDLMFSRVKHTKQLTIADGTIPDITYQSSKLQSFTVLNSKVSSFGVWHERNHVLETLRLIRNNLKVLPTNLRYLMGLVSLDLSQNELEYVNLEEMASMNQLQNLNLSVNKITTIDPPVSLTLNSLKNLEVSFNLLERFDAFPEAFPVLKTVRLMGNKWTCEWVYFAWKSIMERRITTFGVDCGCGEHRQGGLCCYGELGSVSTNKEGLLKEGPLLQQVQVLMNDMANKPIRTSNGQSVLELLTRDEGGEDNDKILVGVKLDDVKVFF